MIPLVSALAGSSSVSDRAQSGAREVLKGLFRASVLIRTQKISTRTIGCICIHTPERKGNTAIRADRHRDLRASRVLLVAYPGICSSLGTTSLSDPESLGFENLSNLESLGSGISRIQESLGSSISQIPESLGS
jgi:hypothetical protein